MPLLTMVNVWPERLDGTSPMQRGWDHASSGERCWMMMLVGGGGG